MCGECGGVLDAHRCVDCDTAHNGHVAWSAMCGDRVVVNGWTGRVVAQHGPYSWVSMEATNSPQTHATSQLVQWPDPPQPTLTGDCDGCPTPTDGCPGDCPQRASAAFQWTPKCTADRRCMAKEHDRNCPQAIALEIAAERKKFVRAAAKRMNQVIEDLPIPDAERQSVKSDLAAEGRRRGRPTINALSSVDHDYCDGCGQLAVVTDVWIDRCPMTLCQPCVLDALTAEGERLGNYWEIES